MTIPEAPTTLQRTLADLERRVLDELEPGAALPSEGALAAELDVSRLTIREAVRTLAARGLIEVRMGRRSVVQAPQGQAVGAFFRDAVRRDAHALLELLEVRRGVETDAAALAAERAGAVDLAAMQAATTAMRIAQRDPEAFHQADVDFHEALAEATGNTLLALLVRQLADPLLASRRTSWQGRERDGRPVTDVLEAHDAILERVRLRDADGAAAAMRAHLADTERDLRAAGADDA